MRIKEEKYQNYKYIIIELNKSEDKDLLERIKQKAKEDSEKQNKKNPKGEIRTEEWIYYSNLAGVLAEESTKLYISHIINKNNLNAEVYSPEFTTHYLHRDIIVKINNRKKTIEVRSSFQTSSHLGISGILTKYFRLLSNYTTSYKKDEPNKDFYITVLHRYNNEEIISKIEDSVEVFIIGGASKEVFDKYGIDDSEGLKQGDACYKIIKPIISCPNDTIEVIEEILEIRKKIQGNILSY